MKEFIGVVTELPGRLAGSQGERMAQAALAGRLDRLGMDTVVEGAVCAPQTSVLLGTHSALLLVALLWSLLSNGLGPVLLTSLVLLSFWGELRGRPRLVRWLLMKQLTGNMVARLRQPGSRGRVVLVAHADVAGASTLFSPWVKRLAHYELIGGVPLHPGTIVLVGGATQLVASILALALPEPSPVALAALLMAAWIHVATLLIAIDWWRSVPTAGAIDNGSGLAVALVAAEHLVNEPLEHCELWVLATGAREADSGGMKAFVRQFAHLLDRRATFFVNLDDVGRGELHFVSSEGRWDRLPYRPSLPALAERLAQSDEFDGVGEVALVGRTDAGPVTEAGYRAVTLTTLVRGRAAEVLHTHQDRLDSVEPRALEQTLRFVLSLAREIDSEFGRGQLDTARVRAVSASKEPPRQVRVD